MSHLTWCTILLIISGFKSENAKQNIILILADDLGINDVLWNNPSAPTPHLHSLATSPSGIILDNAYTLPVCTPSRAALMSGTYPFKLGLQRGFGKHSPEGLPLNITLLPEHLRREGYSTHGFGKWHLGFCSESYTPLRRGFDSYYGLFVGDDDEHTQITQESKRRARVEKKEKIRNRKGREIHNYKKRKNIKKGLKGKNKYWNKNKKKYNQEKEPSKEITKNTKLHYKKKKINNNKEKQPNNQKKKTINQGKKPNKITKVKKRPQKPSKEEKIRQQLLRKPTKFGSNIYGSKAIDVIKSAKKEKPFFIYLALFTKSYPREVSNRRGNINMEVAVAENRRKKLSEMDDSVKQIVKALKTSGQYSNTVIFFISDNGARAMLDTENINNPNYPLRGSKGTVYEGGTKVPAFIHCPGLKTGSNRYAGIFHMVDILPTLLHLAGGHPMAGIDGVNQWEAMSTNLKSPRTTMIYNIDDNFVPAVLDGPGVQPKFQIAIREDNFKLVWGQPKMLHRSYREAKGKGGLVVDQQVLELYNLEKDPREMHNIANIRMDIVLRLKTLALNYYRDLIPPRFMGLQTTNQVLDAKSDFGGLSGWCRAVMSTSCGPLDKNSFYRGRGASDMSELFYGTVPGMLDKRTFCVSKLE